MKLSIMKENIKKIQRNYNDLNKKIYILEQKNYKVINGKCILCEKYLENSDVPIEKKFYNCACCNYYNKVRLCIDEYLSVYNELKKVSKEYAKEIFETLKKEKPNLLVRTTKEIIKWNQAFPEDFNDVNTNLYSTLIALIEEVAGRYRIV